MHNGEGDGVAFCHLGGVDVFLDGRRVMLILILTALVDNVQPLMTTSLSSGDQQVFRLAINN